ncbi:hypothetical protein [Micromonospora sp. NPDC051006]|uniref:hypothetical protein n=1 Tax=Micromonospora sp. NPDC051006 TaxID=3364283 RepID=UPI0037B73053
MTGRASRHVGPTQKGAADITGAQPVVLALQSNDVGDDFAGNPAKVCTGFARLATIGFSGA